LDLRSESPKWATLKGPSASRDVVTRAPIYLDDRRAATHTYYGTQFWEAGNRMVIMPAPGMDWNQLPDPPQGYRWADDMLVTMFDITSNEWDRPDRAARYPGKGDFTACLCCTDVSTGEIYYARSGDANLWKFNPATNVWAMLGQIGH